MLFYKNPVLLNRETHRNLHLNAPADGYTYAAACNAIPLTAPEFARAACEYPIVFVVDEGNPTMPVVMTGLRDAENLFVSASGVWDAGYIPAFVRRYPFLSQDQDQEGNCLVMIDESYSGFTTQGGEPLFGEDGNPAPMLGRMIEFLEDGRRHAGFTEGFTNRLAKYDLLVPHSMEVVTYDNKKFLLNGFSVVDENRLAALSDTQLVELLRSGDLGCIQAHLISLNNVGKLSRALEERLVQETAAA